MYKAVKEKVQVEEKYIYLSFNFHPFYLGNVYCFPLNCLNNILDIKLKARGPNPVRLTSGRVAHWSSA